jgi:hypothetical protein
MSLTKIKLVLLFLIALQTSVQAQKQRYGNNFYVENHNFCDTVSAAFNEDGVIIPVEISGRKYYFRLNTGSIQGSIFRNTNIDGIQELGNVVRPLSNNGSDTIKIVALPCLVIGKTKLHGYVTALPKVTNEAASYDGEIGFDIISNGLLMKIDRKAGQIIITDIPNFFKQEKGYEVNYELKWFLPYVLISPFKRHVDRALFNTSEPYLYTIGNKNFDIHAYKSKNVGHQVEGIANGLIPTENGMQEYPVAFLSLDRLKWDKFAFTKVSAITSENSSCVGSKILDYGAVIINPQKQSITFEPYNGLDSVVVGNRLPGIAIVNNDNRPMISLVFEKSNAYKSGLRRGDIIKKINGKEINSYADFKRFDLKNSLSFNISVLRGKDKIVEIFLKDGFK